MANSSVGEQLTNDPTFIPNCGIEHVGIVAEILLE
jgi:hypothetical protein